MTNRQTSTKETIRVTHCDICSTPVYQTDMSTDYSTTPPAIVLRTSSFIDPNAPCTNGPHHVTNSKLNWPDNTRPL